MEKTSNTSYLKSTLFTREYIFNTSLNNVLEFRALTFRELDNLQTKFKDMPHSLKVQSIKTALLDINDFDLLIRDDDMSELFKCIIEVSNLSKEDYDNIIDGMKISMEKTFEAEDYRSCQLCQEKGLDALRNCPMLDESTHSPMVKYITNNKIYTTCPMYNVNNNPLMNDTLEAYLCYTNKLLPMDGGLVDQTVYFYRIAPAIKNIIDAKQMEDTTKK